MGARLLSSSRESIVALIGHPDLSCSCVQTPEGNSSCQKCQHTQRFYKDERCIRANKILLLRMAQVTHGTFVPIILLLVQRAHRVLHKGSNVKSHHPKCPKGDLTSTTGLCSARSFRRTQLCDDATKRLKYTFYLSDKCAVYTTGNHVYV